MPEDYTAAAEVFAGNRARQAALVQQVQSWTGVPSSDDLGTFDTVTPVDGSELGSIYARLVALSAQRLRVLSAQLAEAYAEHGTDAFVRERLLYDPATEEVRVAGEDVTALARLEAEERDRLEHLLTTAVRLRLETRSREVIAVQGKRMAALVRAMAVEAGLDWSREETRRLAQRAVLRAEEEVAGK